MTTVKHVPPPYHPPPAETLSTLYADDEIIVAAKPSGLLSVPGLGAEKAFCAQSVLQGRFGEAYVVHRLDMDTSGLILFARTKAAQKHLSGQFQARRVSKTYEAVVSGVVDRHAGRVDFPIAKHSLNRPIRHIAVDGQMAITNWTVISRAATATRLSLKPETGRSHQIRLHMKALGHPILGDVFYGDRDRAGRLLLHAKALSFQHPKTETAVSFVARTPF